ncbi:hypothetical protein [Anaerovorax odorimutans]|uniref:hypothetical protein n=1 Tax=Anaerovorax odorimutans TaxID=109327 RepID=UPI000417BA3D|nr:hypothetical protein [Anaerovorax odorimutans]
MSKESEKKIGVGTCSFLFVIFSIVWSFDFNGFCIGDNFLNLIGLSPWSNGNIGIHYTVYYSIIFLLPAYIIAKKFPDHFLAKASKILSLWMGFFLLISSFVLAQ